MRCPVRRPETATGPAEQHGKAAERSCDAFYFAACSKPPRDGWGRRGSGDILDHNALLISSLVPHQFLADRLLVPLQLIPGGLASHIRVRLTSQGTAQLRRWKDKDRPTSTTKQSTMDKFVQLNDTV
ncbi:hypothetical protein NDU88_005393 [Pleurodeles waltl]|uniref:Uncharacterized protein n=1 Tax=Pleurodeles waltl TaxID=8319 RepID=A0AAV7TAN5_PLEWA|nr:hypothetical protein NDU88_005393 [Pleurodeles waltl]